MAIVNNRSSVLRVSLRQSSTDDTDSAIFTVDHSLHKLNTAWNNSFRRIFSCCWRESTRPLQFSCKSLPFCPLLEQRKLILWMKTRPSNNIVLQTLSGVNYHEFLALCSKYDIDISSVTENITKKALWNVFAHTVDI